MLSALLGLQSLLGAIRENYMAREIFEYWIMWWIFWTIKHISVIRGGLWFHCRIISEQCLPIPFASFPLTILWGFVSSSFLFHCARFSFHYSLLSIAIAILWHVCPQEIWKHWYSAVLPGFKTTSSTSETGSTMSCCRPAEWRGWTGRTGPPLPRLRLLRSSIHLKL